MSMQHLEARKPIGQLRSCQGYQTNWGLRQHARNPSNSFHSSVVCATCNLGLVVLNTMATNTPTTLAIAGSAVVATVVSGGSTPTATSHAMASSATPLSTPSSSSSTSLPVVPTTMPIVSTNPTPTVAPTSGTPSAGGSVANSASVPANG